MQTDREIPEIENNESVLRIVSDSQSVSILRAVDREPKSASQLSLECGIFVGKVYRRLKLLQKSGLLDVYYRIRPDGKKFFLYKSRVKEIVVSFDGQDLGLGVTLKEVRRDPRGGKKGLNLELGI
ncbi:MAG: winged helix-turn-helix transcriptional regulator [Thaumarchaeota archaeon]|nr:winged helix-turn-helix transcriptional regulator [Nitrososphaerota archaeon]